MNPATLPRSKHAPSHTSFLPAFPHSLAFFHPPPRTVKAAKEPSVRGGCCFFFPLPFSPPLLPPSRYRVDLAPSLSFAAASPSALPPPPSLLPQTRNRLKPVQTGRFHLGLVFSPWRLAARGRGGGKKPPPQTALPSHWLQLVTEEAGAPVEVEGKKEGGKRNLHKMDP